MANIIIVGGKAINLDHVIKVSHNADAQQVTVYYDAVMDVQRRPRGDGSTELRYRYNRDTFTGDEAEELWSKLNRPASRR